MPSASAAAAAKKAEHGNLLKGKNVPKKMWNGFDVKIVEIREAPKDWTGLFVMDFEEVKGIEDENGEPITALALNKTNTAAIAAKYGDDTDKWTKKTVRLIVYMGRDVGSGKPTPCIAVSE